MAAITEDAAPVFIPYATFTAPGTGNTAGPASQFFDFLTTLPVVSNVVGGTVTAGATGFTFTPTADFAGTASFTYTVSDDGETNGRTDKRTASATATMQVIAVNDAPRVATPIADVTIAEDGVMNFSIVPNFIDVDSVDLRYGISLPDGSAAPGTIACDLLTARSRAVLLPTRAVRSKLRVTAQSLSGGSVTDTFTLNVTAVPEAPVLSAPLPDLKIVQNSSIDINLAALFSDRMAMP